MYITFSVEKKHSMFLWIIFLDEKKKAENVYNICGREKYTKFVYIQFAKTSLSSLKIEVEHDKPSIFRIYRSKVSNCFDVKVR